MMIPVLLFVGLPIGLLPRWWSVAGVVVAAAVWTYLWADDDLIHGVADAAFVYAFGAVNLGIGASITSVVKRFVLTARRNRSA